MATQNKQAWILSRLKEEEGSYVSSKELCDAMAISRTAVWKHIQTLMAKGYPIEATP
nr:helix-turn-helix domain-containing protein [Bacilli bacterium]